MRTRRTRAGRGRPGAEPAGDAAGGAASPRGHCRVRPGRVRQRGRRRADPGTGGGPCRCCWRSCRRCATSRLPEKLVAFGEIGLAGEVRPGAARPGAAEGSREARLQARDRAEGECAEKRRSSGIEVIGVERVEEAVAQGALTASGVSAGTQQADGGDDQEAPLPPRPTMRSLPTPDQFAGRGPDASQQPPAARLLPGCAARERGSGCQPRRAWHPPALSGARFSAFPKTCPVPSPCRSARQAAWWRRRSRRPSTGPAQGWVDSWPDWAWPARFRSVSDARFVRRPPRIFGSALSSCRVSGESGSTKGALCAGIAPAASARRRLASPRQRRSAWRRSCARSFAFW